jgi:hypothetical protein
MSIISDYISQVKNAIEKLPCVLADELIIDNRGDVVIYEVLELINDLVK